MNPIKIYVITQDESTLKEENSTSKKIMDLSPSLGLKPEVIFVNKINHETLDDIDLENAVVFVRGSKNNVVRNSLHYMLEKGGAFVINSYEAFRLSQNKFKSYLFFGSAGIDMPETHLVMSDKNIDIDLEQVVFKPVFGSEGIGITRSNKENILPSIQNYLRFESEVLIQKYIDVPEDYRVLVLNGKAIATTRRIKKGDFRSNTAVGSTAKPYAEISDDEIKFCEKVARLSGLYYCAVDYLRDDSKNLLLEVNGSPGSGAVYHSLTQGREINGGELVLQVLTYISERKHWHRTPNVVGLIEEIDILELGSCDAKLDTGNESVSSLHASKIKDRFSTVEFSIGDDTFVKQVQDRVKIRNGNEVDDRVVVFFDVKFGGKLIKDVPFNLNDRSDNDYDVLIGADFLTNNNYAVNPARNHLLSGKECKIKKPKLAEKIEPKIVEIKKTKIIEKKRRVEIRKPKNIEPSKARRLLEEMN